MSNPDTFIEPAYALVDARAMNRLHPTTFLVPAYSDLARIAPGWAVWR